MKTTRSFLLLLMLLATSGLNAQKEEDKYAALVSEVRNEVWSLNLPDFKNMTCLLYTSPSPRDCS